MFQLIKPDINFDFVGKRAIWLGLSGLAVLATLVLFFTKGLNYGIDFSGGAEIHLKIPSGWDTSKLRSVLEAGGIGDARVQRIGDVGSRDFLVRAQGDEKGLAEVAGQVSSALKKEISESEFSIERSDIVGPAAGSSLRRQGALAMFYALLVILVYVALRFDSRYAPGAVIALFHDSLVILGVFIVTGKQFDLTILAAILALVGYSNNDTIIVFDRVRETVHNHPEYSIEKAVNKAINETLGRTLVTSLTTFLVVSSLWVFGGPVLENFAFALMVGVIVGTYSSIFIASSLVITLTNRHKKKKNKQYKSKKEYKVRPEPMA